MRFLRRQRAKPAPMSATGITDIGSVRSSNQDNFVVLLGKDTPLGDALIAVADGMGGHAAGEVASQVSLDSLRDALSNAASPNGKTLREAFEQANRMVYSTSLLDGLQGMGATLVAGLVVEGVLFICNVGDSRAYLLRDGTLSQVTRDHSWVGDMVAKGLLTSEQAAVHPRRNVLTRALGIGETVQVDPTRILLRQRDRILLCSDGLHGLVNDSTIAAILGGKSLRRAARDLVKSAKRAGGTDNITVIVAQMDCASRIDQSERVDDMSDTMLGVQ